MITDKGSLCLVILQSGILTQKQLRLLVISLGLNPKDPELIQASPLYASLFNETFTLQSDLKGKKDFKPAILTQFKDVKDKTKALTELRETNKTLGNRPSVSGMARFTKSFFNLPDFEDYLAHFKLVEQEGCLVMFVNDDDDPEEEEFYRELRQAVKISDFVQKRKYPGNSNAVDEHILQEFHMFVQCYCDIEACYDSDQDCYEFFDRDESLRFNHDDIMKFGAASAGIDATNFLSRLKKGEFSVTDDYDGGDNSQE